MRRMAVLAAVLAMMASPVFGLPVVVNGDFNSGNAGWTQYGGGYGINETVHNTDIGAFPTPDLGPYGTVTFWSNMGHSGQGSAGRYQIVDTSLYIGQPLTLEVLGQWHNHGQQWSWHEWGVIDGTNTDPNNLGGWTFWMEKRESPADPNPPGDAWQAFSIDFTPTQSTITVFYKGGTNTGDASLTRAKNFTITPEPTALMLLGLGLIPMLRRRRR